MARREKIASVTQVTSPLCGEALQWKEKLNRVQDRFKSSTAKSKEKRAAEISPYVGRAPKEPKSAPKKEESLSKSGVKEKLLKPAFIYASVKKGIQLAILPI